MHPNYTYTSKEYDIALVKVNAPMEWNERVGPVPGLPQEGGEALEGAACNASGWGLTQENGLLLASNLQYVRKKVPKSENSFLQLCFPLRSLFHL